MTVFVFVPPHAPLYLHILPSGLCICQHVHTFMCVWVGTAAAYSWRPPAPPRWWLTAAISFLSEWVYNPCYNALIIQFAYICLVSTKHVRSRRNSSAPAAYLISLYYNITWGPLVPAFIWRAFTVLWVWTYRTPILGTGSATLYFLEFCYFHCSWVESLKTHTDQQLFRKKSNHLNALVWGRQCSQKLM